MSRFTKKPQGLQVSAPIKGQPVATGLTGNNAPGFARDANSELFLLAVSNFVGQNTFYEDANKRDGRFVGLIHAVAAQDPAWLARFLVWLRCEANMRTAAIVGAVEFCRAYKSPNRDSLVGLPRLTMDRVLQRADEPSEAVGYHLQTYGRQMPKSMKRALADATIRLYTEYNVLKYDTESSAIRFADVLELAQTRPGLIPTPLYQYLQAKRHKRTDLIITDELPMIWNNQALRFDARRDPSVLLNANRLKASGMTWEDVLSLAGSKVPKAKLWEAIIPSMGYMALLRNLRNFDEAQISDAAAQHVIAKLISPAEVARSRQLPMRFLSAYNAVSNLRWGYPLEQALELSLANVPQFEGKTLILIDTSGSMDSVFSKDGTLRYWDAAAMFGLALARRCDDATVVSFSDTSREFPMARGASLLALLAKFRQSYFYGRGTETQGALQRHYAGHDRVVILTDEQANRHLDAYVGSMIPKHKLVATFNLAGYQYGHAPSGQSNLVAIGGLTDQAFKLLPMLEQRAAGQWPF